MKMIYFNIFGYMSDGFVYHYNKLKELEPNKWD